MGEGGMDLVLRERVMAYDAVMKKNTIN